MTKRLARDPGREDFATEHKVTLSVLPLLFLAWIVGTIYLIFNGGPISWIGGLIFAAIVLTLVARYARVCYEAWRLYYS